MFYVNLCYLSTQIPRLKHKLLNNKILFTKTFEHYTTLFEYYRQYTFRHFVPTATRDSSVFYCKQLYALSNLSLNSLATSALK